MRRVLKTGATVAIASLVNFIQPCGTPSLPRS
jgi:hypothetical protein